MISLTRMTRKTIWLYCILAPILIFFFIDKNVGTAFFSFGLVTILYYEDKFYNIQQQKLLKEKKQKKDESKE